jgi:hypothetical protein
MIKSKKVLLAFLFGLSMSAASAVKAAEKEWTVMVYMGFHGREFKFIQGAAMSMQKTGTTRNVNLVLQASARYPNATRYLVQRSADDKQFGSKPLVQLGATDFGDYRNVVDFVKWARREFPARRYALILYGHGWGWEEKKATRGMFTGSGYQHVRNGELRKILEEAGRVDILAMYSCQMQMAEVAYETGAQADLILGSEELLAVKTHSFYPAFIGILDIRPNASPGDISSEVFRAMRNEWKSFSSEIDIGQTFSAINGGKMVKLAELLREWTGTVRSCGAISAVKYARDKVLRFGMVEYNPDERRKYQHFADLYHFVALVGENSSYAEVREKSEKLKRFISDELVAGHIGMFNRSNGDYEANSHGISIEMLPRLENPHLPYLEATYRNSSSFAVESGWADFLKWAGEYD